MTRMCPCGAGDPIPLTTQYVLVSNLCPECKTGDLDQEKAGDGRWNIEWYPVQCAVGNTPFVYSFQGSNPYYIKMQIANHRHAPSLPQSLAFMQLAGDHCCMFCLLLPHTNYCYY